MVSEKDDLRLLGQRREPAECGDRTTIIQLNQAVIDQDRHAIAGRELVFPRTPTSWQGTTHLRCRDSSRQRVPIFPFDLPSLMAREPGPLVNERVCHSKRHEALNFRWRRIPLLTPSSGQRFSSANASFCNPQYRAFVFLCGNGPLLGGGSSTPHATWHTAWHHDGFLRKGTAATDSIPTLGRLH